MLGGLWGLPVFSIKEAASVEAHKTNRILCCLIEKVKISKINRPKAHQRKLHSCGYNEIGSCMEKCFKKKPIDVECLY